MIALSNSIHIYARPDTKEKLLEFFTSILGLEAKQCEAFKTKNQPVDTICYDSERCDTSKAYQKMP